MRLGLLVLCLALLGPFLGEYGLKLLSEALILGLYAMAFNLLFHQAGLLSFGQAAFFGVGAYAMALLMARSGWSFLATLPLAFLLGGAAAFLVGFLSLRLTRIYFTMLTLAFAQLLYAVAHKWYAFTGGDNGITDLRPAGPWGESLPFYYLTLGLFGLLVGLLASLERSPFGYALRALRDNRARAEAVGLDGFRHLLLAFALAGAISGVAGALQGALQRSVFPDYLFWTRSAEAIISTILGGSGVFLGPAVGAAAFLFLRVLVQAQTEYWPFFLGLLLLLMVLFFPRGLAGVWARLGRGISLGVERGAPRG
ncbi:Inner-membrane translocator [Thermus sp. CCB_US3_UF1]|uniref:branched-chain amino acid ABC transporter permease n=1 Tax=Thermus sp. CCB_US3_UF1 TaxID=1111069 RepID=UPI000238A398|nr:branched-chain amino acid ABC transporter permease [Thermus sp. CCB_US3_UF1]AEV15129.1 Inner-membrane translocator [Thermus sp. CCB_US3_UF1]